ncbi:MAG TPA: NADH-quinone oxidoreductase subunit J [Candidatus Baltobacteraceae bacterium]|nr:NADH-quinone oxidoreductase subunit J [Candidatus Baltobacteraceae bacterium]
MILYWGLAVVLIASAMWCITAPKPVYSVVALLLNFVALAATYLTLNAEFLAVIQLIVYSGAILVLFLFVIALLSSGVAPFATGPDRLPRIVYPAVALVVIALGFLTWSLAHTAVVTPASAAGGSTLGPAGTAGVFGSVADFGTALFTTYLLPFEITALILMVAVIGVVLLAGDQAPYTTSKKHAEEVRREMREAILREGD